MIGYVTVGTNDLPRAVAFYERLLAPLGVKRTWDSERGVAWGRDGQPSLGVMKPFDGQPATRGNGTMVALAAGSREQVDQIHKLAMTLGAADEGAPGPRGEGFYAAYFRDLDGNKLNVFCFG
jgi:catechol 2,3-dioxygenase-like lactoylglutathione lyase family enzyme